MRGRRRKLNTAVVSPDAARRHIAVIYLIRGVEILVAVPTFGLIALLGACFVLKFNPFRHPQDNNEYFSVIMLTLILLVSAVMIAKTVDRFRKSGGDLFRNFQKVDENSVSTFAFIFSALASHDLYHFLPPELPRFIQESIGDVIVLHRDILTIIAFFMLWHVSRAVLFRVLELNPKTPPRDPEPPDQSGSGPFVPFDPCHPYSAKPLYNPPGQA
jgi:hypothetical protein